MPELRFKQPCNDCPFRRASTPGWLGGHEPRWFVNMAEADHRRNEGPCHQTIDYSDPNWVETQYPDSAICAGALIYARNNCKMPRDPERAALLQEVEVDYDNVLSGHEFEEHHTQKGSMRSWEYDKEDVA